MKTVPYLLDRPEVSTVDRSTFNAVTPHTRQPCACVTLDRLRRSRPR